MKQQPQVGVGVIIMNRGRVLLLRRKNAHGEGSWCFPGGHLEFNEELADCARREVQEETGLTVSNIQFAGLTNDLFREEEKHYITIFMACAYASGEAQIKEPEKCTGMDWFGWRALPQPLFLPIQHLLDQGYDPFRSSVR